MKELCEICAREPYSHSFRPIHDTSNVCVFYTCIANAKKYDDEDGIVQHYDAYLNAFDKEWIWLLDCKGLSAKHLVCHKVGIRLCELLYGDRGYEKRLKKIVIVNPDIYVRMLYTIMWPFLTENTNDKVIFDYDNKPLCSWF